MPISSKKNALGGCVYVVYEYYNLGYECNMCTITYTELWNIVLYYSPSV